MTLPVSADYPIAPIVQYDLYTPPFIPAINVMPGFEHIVPMVAATVANEAGLKASHHAGRMFLYNLLVDNYWNNPVFAEVVKLVIDIIAINYRKQLIRSPEQGIQDAVVQAMGSYTSTLFVNYPELKSLVAPQILDAAYQNMSFFNNLKQEISSMYYHTPGHHMPAAHGPHPGTPNPGMHPGHVHPAMMHPGAMHPGAPMPGQGWGQPPQSNWGQPNMPPQPNWGHGHQMSNYPAQPAARDMSNGPTFASSAVTNARFGQPAETNPSDRFASRPVNRMPEPTLPTQVQASQRETVKKEEQTTLIIEENCEMDRSKHQIVLLGESYVPKTDKRYQDYSNSTHELSRSRPMDKDPENATVSYTLAMEPCIDHAIVHGRVKQFKHQADNSVDNVFRCFAVLASPFLCTQDINEYMENIKDANTFASLANKLRSMAVSLSTMEDDENRKYTSAVAMFLMQMDQKLTRMVNEYLGCNLRLKTRISSFTEDVAALPQFLYERYGGESSRAFERFENDAISAVLCNLDEDLINEHMDYFDIGDMKYGLMPTTCSLTFVHLTNKELGFKIDTSDAVVIDQATAPTLHKLASSLVDHKKQLQSLESQMSVIDDYLITADNVRYKLYRNPLRHEEYLIAKA